MIGVKIILNLQMHGTRDWSDITATLASCQSEQLATAGYGTFQTCWSGEGLDSGWTPTLKSCSEDGQAPSGDLYQRVSAKRHGKRLHALLSSDSRGVRLTGYLHVH